MFKDVDQISVTTDIWTSCAQDSYMSLTAHFIDKEFERKNI